jgi:hypothetical protein
VIWMPGINARGAAHPRCCTFLTDPGRRDEVLAQTRRHEPRPVQ